MSINQLVTIGIPTYKRLEFLKQAVASALAQTYPDIEIIISQDPGETQLDSSIERWSRALVAKNPKVRYYSNQFNLGLAGNWNAIADVAKGDFLVIIGDDDRLLPDFVENLMKVIQSTTTVAFCNHYLINSLGERLEQLTYEHTKLYKRDQIPSGKLSNAEMWVWQNAIPMSAALIKTKEVQKFRFKEDLNTPEIELFIRLAQAEKTFVFLPEYLSEYRTHSHSATAKGLKINKLVNYLLPMPVSNEVEPYKREMLEKLIVTATSQHLLQGEREKAIKLLKSEYYPSFQKKHLKSLIQSLCTKLPPFLGYHLYRLVDSIKYHF